MRFTIPKLFSAFVAASSIVVARPPDHRGSTSGSDTTITGGDTTQYHRGGSDTIPPHRGSDKYQTGDSTQQDQQYTVVAIQPDFLIQIKMANPNQAFGKTDWGVVSRTNGQNDISTLASFWIPPEYSGKQCKLVFYQAHDLGGSMSAQVFTVIGTIPVDATFNTRPSRNVNVASFVTDWTMAYSHAKFTYYGGEYFDCPGDQTLGYGLVPVGDNDYIEWEQWYGFAIHVKY